MKINLLLLFVLLFTTSCATKIKSINGNWRQVFLGYEGDKEGYGIVSDSVLITLSLNKPSQITFDYNDDFEKDNADSIIYNYPQLNFRKQNLNKTYNHYFLTYDANCDCFNGLFKSFNGNRIKVKWVRN